MLPIVLFQQFPPAPPKVVVVLLDFRLKPSPTKTLRSPGKSDPVKKPGRSSRLAPSRRAENRALPARSAQLVRDGSNICFHLLSCFFSPWRKYNTFPVVTLTPRRKITHILKQMEACLDFGGRFDQHPSKVYPSVETAMDLEHPEKKHSACLDCLVISFSFLENAPKRPNECPPRTRWSSFLCHSLRRNPIPGSGSVHFLLEVAIESQWFILQPPLGLNVDRSLSIVVFGIEPMFSCPHQKGIQREPTEQHAEKRRGRFVSGQRAEACG